MSVIFTFNPLRVQAHPLGNFSLNHYTLLIVYPQGILAQHVLDFAELPSYNELVNVDTNDDNRVTPEEIRHYQSAIQTRFLPGFSYSEVDPDGKMVILTPQKLLQNDVILSRGQGSLTCLQVRLAGFLPIENSSKPGKRTFSFQDDNLSYMRGIQEIRIQPHSDVVLSPEDMDSGGSGAATRISENLYVVPGVKITIRYEMKPAAVGVEPQLTDPRLFMNPGSIPQFPLEPDADGSYAILKSPIQPNPEVQSRIAPLQSKKVLNATETLFSGSATGQTSTGPGITTSPTSPYMRTATDSDWANLIGTQDLSPKMVALAVLFSIFFGASHALSPGHGKTVVAAYLVGSRGTVGQAIFLGLVVTLTHVFSVFVLGIITLYFSQYIVPDKLYPIIEAVSGLLIVGIGGALFFRRFAAYQRMRYAESLGIDAPGLTHQHPHVHPHERDHPHNHDHHHERGHEPIHTHETQHWLDHKHGPGTHTHEIPANATLKDLLLLGITGGIVPCPSAIVVLVAAIALHRILFGLTLIVFFSIGLASVLISIGILMVTAKRYLEHFQKREKKILMLQIISPVLVSLLGFIIFLRGLQNGGIISINF